MARFGVSSYRYMLLVPALLLLIVLAAWLRVPRAQAHWYLPSNDALANPLCGLAVDAASEPVASDEAAALVYARATWRELEPEPGKYDFSAFEERVRLQDWFASGAKLVLRIALDEPGEPGHMDIPDWLYAMTGDGAFYTAQSGSGYAPDYSNLILTQAHYKLLEAVAARYVDTGALAYIEMGSLGSDGDWTAARDEPALPMMDVASAYIWQYTNVFAPDTVLACRPYREAALVGAGAYNEFVGDEEQTFLWTNAYAFGGWDSQLAVDLRVQEDFGRSAPAGAHLCAGLRLSELDEEGLDALVRTAEESRAVYLAGDFSDADAETLNLLRRAVGYRLWVRQADWPARVRRDYSLYVDITVRNDGCASFPREWPVQLALLRDGAPVYAETIETSPDKWLPGDTSLRVRITMPADMEKGEYTLALGVLDPDTGAPAVRFAMQDQSGAWAELGAVRVY